MGHTVDILSPLEFRTLPCPTYPDIRLSLFCGRGARKRICEFAPDALHIATEGPLGLAARAWAIKNNFPYTTAYHTRFPEYVHARFRIPLKWTYRYLNWFHGKARAVMAPTLVVKADLETQGFDNVVIWGRGVELDIFYPRGTRRLGTRPPIFLYVGRVAVEKNIEAFLELDLPGSKWVVGEGPALSDLRMKYPETNFLGVLAQNDLAEIYSSADAFVFPSKTDTFGLVLLEAMACGLPVAAYPVTGPLDVIGDSPGGALNHDLERACMDALALRREDAARHASKYSWRAATEQFLAHIHPHDRSSA